MTLERNNLTKVQTVTVAAIEERLPDLIEARDVVESFHAMLRHKSLVNSKNDECMPNTSMVRGSRL